MSNARLIALAGPLTILVGVDAPSYRLLLRWNLSPLLAGSTVVLSLVLNWLGVRSFITSRKRQGRSGIRGQCSSAFICVYLRPDFLIVD